MRYLDPRVFHTFHILDVRADGSRARIFAFDAGVLTRVLYLPLALKLDFYILWRVTLMDIWVVFGRISLRCLYAQPFLFREE